MNIAKTYFYIAVIILGLLNLSAQAKTFSRGSLIIPMDPCWQPNYDPAVDPEYAPPPTGNATWCDTSPADDAVFHAYGLVYDLLEIGVPVYWIVKSNKTDRNGIDFTINGGTGAPVKKFNSTTQIDPPQRTVAGQLLEAHVIDYRGGPFVIDVKDLSTSARQIVTKWMETGVKVHESLVDFSAPVEKVLNTTPPKIAVLGGLNTSQILVDYLRAMGMGTRTADVYDLVGFQDIANGILNDYQLFWAPHWELDKDPADPTLQNKVLQKLREFLEAGNSAFLECASIESIEGSSNLGLTNATTTYGGWLTDKNYRPPRIETNLGSMNPEFLVFENPAFYLPQCAGWIFEPKGGHVHNFRPVQPGYTYNLTVQRFVHDRDGAYNGYDPGFDYFVGGRINGSPTQGYVSYLAGHKYIKCAPGTTTAIDLKFKEDISNLKVYVEAVYSGCTENDTCPKGWYDLSTRTFQNASDGVLEISFNDVSAGKTDLKTIIFQNSGNSSITLSKIIISWENANKHLKEIKAGKDRLCNYGKDGTSSPASCSVSISITPSTDITSCDPDWNQSNTCGIRYVLNTIFGLQFTVISHEYVTSSPVIDENILYVASFEFPGHKGHLHAYDLSSTNATELWDAAYHIPQAFSRKIYTYDGNSILNFEETQASVLQPYLGTSSENSTIALINTVRGRYGASESNPQGTRDFNFKLWGIEYSTPAVLRGSYSISGQEHRDRIIFVGANDGMLHAFDGGTWDNSTNTYTVGSGEEKWAFIPYHFLPHLKNQPFNDYNRSAVVSVDGSPALGDFWLDTGVGYQWKTVLVETASIIENGTGIAFALDVTDPYQPQVLWEKDFSDLNAGRSRGIAIGEVYSGNELKTVAYLITNFAEKESENGTIDPVNGNYGVKAIAINIATGERLWTFSSLYSDTASNINEIPYLPALIDFDDNGETDFVVFGDYEGRLWVLDAKTGKSIKTLNGKDQPIFTTSGGNNEPITGGIAIYKNWIIFGTGGADYTPDTATYHIYALQISSTGEIIQTLSYELDPGEKVWAAPIVDRYGHILVAVSKGYKRNLKPDEILSAGRIIILNLQGGSLTLEKSVSTSGAQVGDIAIGKGVAVAVSFTGKVTRFGQYEGSAGENSGEGSGSGTVTGNNTGITYESLPVKIFKWEILR